jgi:hypothetical protein
MITPCTCCCRRILLHPLPFFVPLPQPTSSADPTSMSRALLFRSGLLRLPLSTRAQQQQLAPLHVSFNAASRSLSTFRQPETVTKYGRSFGFAVAVAAGWPARAAQRLSSRCENMRHFTASCLLRFFSLQPMKLCHVCAAAFLSYVACSLRSRPLVPRRYSAPTPQPQTPNIFRSLLSAAGGWGLSAAAPAATEQTKAAVVMPKDKIVLYQVTQRA